MTTTDGVTCLMTDTMAAWRDPASTAVSLDEAADPVVGVATGVAVGAARATGRVVGLAPMALPTSVPDVAVVDDPHAATTRISAIRRADRAPTPRVER